MGSGNAIQWPLKPGRMILFDLILGQVREVDAALWAMGVRDAT